jgi:hypothetical protein
MTRGVSFHRSIYRYTLHRYTLHGGPEECPFIVVYTDYTLHRYALDGGPEECPSIVVYIDAPFTGGKSFVGFSM